MRIRALAAGLVFGAIGCSSASSQPSREAHSAKSPAPTRLAAHAPPPTTPRAPTSAQLEAASTAGAEEPRTLTEPRPASERGWLGVDLAKRAGTEPGVLIRDIVRGSPAARAGVVGGDVIVSVDGENVARPEDVSRLVAVRGAGQRVRLGLLRGTDTRLLAIDLERFPNADELMRREFLNQQAPEFEELETAQGAVEPRLASLRGKVVVLEFWASWCGPCHLLSPVLQGWHERLQPQGVVVAGVSAESTEIVSRSAYQMGIGYAVFADPSGATTKAYRAMALPTVFVLDKSGRVRDVMVGYSSPGLARLETLVKKLIQES